MPDRYELLARFMKLFSGFDEAYGTGKGQWIKRPPRSEDYLDHLEGKGPGLGIGPLRKDGAVTFAAIDLDAPDFEGARAFQEWIPGTSWIERSRSGNAHVWVFFDGPCEAWVATGILHAAIKSAGYKNVEVFPKQTSFNRVRMGNYINLPYYGDSRPIVIYNEGRFKSPQRWHSMALPLERFLDEAEANLNKPEAWKKRAVWMQISDPATASREPGEAASFGERSTPHICADWVIEGALSGERPVLKGARSVVYFNLAKQLANCSLYAPREVLEILMEVRNASDAYNSNYKPESEIARYVRNAYEKQYTSTGCDDPVFGPYAHPDCRIAHPRR